MEKEKNEGRKEGGEKNSFLNANCENQLWNQSSVMLSGNSDEMWFAFYGLEVSGIVGWVRVWKFLLCKLHLLQSTDHRWYKSKRLECFGSSVHSDTSGSLFLYEEWSFVPEGTAPDTEHQQISAPHYAWLNIGSIYGPEASFGSGISIDTEDMKKYLTLRDTTCFKAQWFVRILSYYEWL